MGDQKYCGYETVRNHGMFQATKSLNKMRIKNLTRNLQQELFNYKALGTACKQVKHNV